MKRHHESLLRWEHDVVNDPYLKDNVLAQQFKENVSFALNHPARLVMDAFESIDFDYRRLRRFGYKDSCTQKEAGEHLLQTLIQTFPDNKIVEDLHNALRLEARGNKNNKIATSTMQTVCMNAGVLESRGIVHNATVQESDFNAALKSKSGGLKGFKECFESKGHRLHEDYIKICGLRTWPALTEESLETAAAR